MSSFVGNVVLAFNTIDNNRLYVPAFIDVNLADPSMGEVVFRIDTTTSTKILASTNKGYFIINQTNPETIIYSGTFDKVENRATNQQNNAKSILESLDRQIQTQQNKLAELSNRAANTTVVGGQTSTTSATTSSASTQALTELAKQNAKLAQENAKLLSQAYAAQQEAIRLASQNKVRPNLIDIPGTGGGGAFNPMINIRPLVENPTNPKDGKNVSTNPTTQGNTRR
jgi:alanyl-tRNA synthetase